MTEQQRDEWTVPLEEPPTAKPPQTGVPIHGNRPTPIKRKKRTR